MCLTIGVTLLDSTIETQLVLYSQFIIGAPVWNDKVSVYLRISLVLLAYFYMYLIHPSVESQAIAV